MIKAQTGRHPRVCFPCFSTYITEVTKLQFARATGYSEESSLYEETVLSVRLKTSAEAVGQCKVLAKTKEAERPEIYVAGRRACEQEYGGPFYLSDVTREVETTSWG